jgi:hypothetical protein
MATTTRQSTKTITMPAATMTSPPEESVPERGHAAQAGGAWPISPPWIDKRKARMRPMRVRKKRDW